MAEFRKSADDPPGGGSMESREPVDVDRLKDLTALGDAKALDPRSPLYDPSERVRPREYLEENQPVVGLDRPGLRALSGRVHAISATLFHAEVKVGGTTRDSGPAESRPPSDASPDEVDAPREDDFGPVDTDRWRTVPCAPHRPQRVYELRGSDAPLLETEADAVTEAKVKISEVLNEASGEELAADDVQEALQYVNPTGGRFNCVECAMAVDDILRGRAAAAGPTKDQPTYFVESALSVRSHDYIENLTAAEVERFVRDAGPGARGIVIGWTVDGASHAYNVANIEGETYWLDGQFDLMTEHDPHGYKTFELYPTDDEAKQ